MDDGEPLLKLLETVNNPELWAMYRDADKMSPDNLKKYSQMLQELIVEHNNKKSINRCKRGKLLEQLVNFMLKNSGNMYKVYSNFHTNTNEIDQIIVLSDKGKACRALGGYDFKGSHFLGECKNYKKAVGVTFVGKFCHLAQASASKLGVLFSYYGFTGADKSWNDSVGLVKKFHLLKEKADDRYYIIDFNLTDFKAIEKGKTFYQIINAKCLALETDTKYSDYIVEHPAECDLPCGLP